MFLPPRIGKIARVVNIQNNTPANSIQVSNLRCSNKTTGRCSTKDEIWTSFSMPQLRHTTIPHLAKPKCLITAPHNQHAYYLSKFTYFFKQPFYFSLLNEDVTIKWTNFYPSSLLINQWKVTPKHISLLTFSPLNPTIYRLPAIVQKVRKATFVAAHCDLGISNSEQTYHTRLTLQIYPITGLALLLISYFSSDWPYTFISWGLRLNRSVTFPCFLFGVLQALPFLYP